MPVEFLSSPSVARFNVSVSAVSEAENWVEDAFKAWARVKRDDVKLADSVSLLVIRSGAFVWIVAAGVRGCRGWCRLRKVDEDSC